ncbi:MAG: hypothetical protein CMK79_12930 [Pseudomonadales bacterium]|nr:hypothetical protein [Pseudomonadales bacterium]
MNPVNYILIILRELKQAWIERLLRYRIQYYNPTLYTHHSVIWNYGFNWLDSLEIGKDVYVMPGAEIIVFKKTKNSQKEGKLILKDHSVIGTGVNIRAAGGVIELGEYSGIGEHSVVVAANHSTDKDHLHIRSPWDEDRTDVIIGRNVWIGANSCLLAGSRVGDNSIVGAGSVVTGEIPANEIWAGVPARKIKDL